jgi:hypothetical protein
VKSIASSFRCAQRTTSTAGPDDTMAWARDCVKNPSQYLATPREAAIVADLLAQAEREGNR